MLTKKQMHMNLTIITVTLSEEGEEKIGLKTMVQILVLILKNKGNVGKEDKGSKKIVWMVRINTLQM